MGEQRIPVKTYIVRLICDCGGEMLPAGIALPSMPPRYVHRCLNCDVTIAPTCTYPRVDYEVDDEDNF